MPKPSLSDKELAALAKLSERGAGKRTFRTTDAALKYLDALEDYLIAHQPKLVKKLRQARREHLQGKAHPFTGAC